MTVSSSGFSDASTVLLVGGSGDIASATARMLTKLGVRLALASRPSERLDSLAAELDAVKVELDAADFEAVDRAFDYATEVLGPLTGAANLVGTILLKPAHLTTRVEYDETIAQNLTTAFACVRAAGRTMTSDGGSLVLMSSCAARVGLASHEAIAAAKAGVIGLMQSAAATYAPRGLRVNAVAPGLVRTKLAEKITRNEASAKASRAMHPLDRLGDPEDIARAIVWLLDPANSWITGQTLGVDGGLATVRTRAQA